MSIRQDIIHEYTPGSGVTIEGVLLKDGLVAGAGGSTDPIDALTAETLNSDLTLAGNGTGDVLVGNTNLLKSTNILPIGGSGAILLNGIVWGPSGGNIDLGNRPMLADNITAVSGNLTIHTNIILDGAGSISGVNELSSTSVLVGTINSVDASITTSCTTDDVRERAIGHGVTVSGVHIKDGSVTASGIVTVSQISENTVNAGVTVDGVLLKDGVASLSGALAVNTINELTSANGVDVATIAFKDGGIDIPGKIMSDDISERTSGNGVTIDGVLAKDSNIKVTTLNVDRIEEYTASSGVTISEDIDALSISNLTGSTLTIDEIQFTGDVIENVDEIANVTNVTIVNLYSETVATDTVNERTLNAGVTIEGVSINDDVTVNTADVVELVTDSVVARTGDIVTVEDVEFDINGDITAPNGVEVSTILDRLGPGLSLEDIVLNVGNIYSPGEYDIEWSPSYDSLLNYAGSTTFTRNLYVKVGKLVFCTARFANIYPTAANTICRFRFELPFAAYSPTGDGVVNQAVASNCYWYTSFGCFPAIIQDWANSDATHLGYFIYPLTVSGTRYYSTLTIIYVAA